MNTLELTIGEEKIPKNFDFSGHTAIQAGLTITGIVEIVIVPGGEVIAESPTIDPTGKIVQALFTPGTVENVYSVYCKVTTNGAAKPIIPGKLRVIRG